MLDVDYHDADGVHVGMPDETARDIAGHLVAGEFDGNVAHLTPRGFRIVAVFGEGAITDRELFERSLRGFAELIASGLRSVGMHAADDSAGLLGTLPAAVRIRGPATSEALFVLPRPLSRCAYVAVREGGVLVRSG